MSLTDQGLETFTCSGASATCKNNSHPTTSADGTLVAFESDADGVVALSANPGHLRWIYVRDLANETTELVSRADWDAAAPDAPPDADCGFPVISRDGRFVAYVSSATNLTGDDVDPTQDVFVRDRLLGRTRRVGGGVGSWSLGAASPSLSFDGSVIAVGSASVPGIVSVPGTGQLVEVVEAGTPFTRIFCLAAAGGIAEWIDRPFASNVSSGDSTNPALSTDARWVAFESTAANLLASTDSNGGVGDVFVRDRLLGTLQCASADLAGDVAATQLSTKSAISGNGRFVVFESRSANLVSGDTNGVTDVFVRDLVRKRTVRASVDLDGHEMSLDSGYGAISDDGRYVLFSSRAERLVPMDSLVGVLDVFLRDRDVSGDGVFDEPGDMLVRIVSVTPDGLQGNAVSGGNADLSADGRIAVFMSHADNLVSGDTNGFALPGSGGTCTGQCIFGRDVFWARLW